jgi:hypothetical protein
LDTPDFADSARGIVTEFFREKVAGYFTVSIKSLKRNQADEQIALLLGSVAKAKIFDVELSNIFLNAIQDAYINKKRVTSKNQHVHLLVLKVSTIILKSAPIMLSERNQIISHIFVSAMGLIVRFV